MSTVTIPYRYGVRGGTAANLATVNEVPLVRELIFETDTLKYKLGDGVTHYNDLEYAGISQAADIPYDNTTSGLAATDVQAAIDEVAASGGGATPTGTGFRHVTSGVEDGATVTIDGQSTLASGDVKVIAPATHAATSKSTPDDADELPLVDSAASWVLKKLSLANLWTNYLKPKVDTLIANGPAGTGAYTVVVKRTTETRNSTTTAAPDAELTFPCASGVTYSVRIYVHFAIANGTMDFKYSPSYTGTTSFIRNLARHSDPGKAAGTGFEFMGYSTSFSGSSPLGTAASNGQISMELLFTTTSAGTFSFDWAQNTSDPANATVFAGSHLEYIAL